MKRTESAKKRSRGKGTSTKTAASLPRNRPTGFVVCVDNSQYPASLERHKIYRVLVDEDAAREGDLRVIDESGEDYLYRAEWFVPIKPPSQVKAVR
jgi:hypothetical protein